MIIIDRAKFVVACLIYCIALTYIYLDEIVLHWSYMGFTGEFSFLGSAVSLILTFILSIACPLKNETRTYIMMTMIFFSFIPSVIFFSYSVNVVSHGLVFCLAIFLFILFSSINISMPYFGISSQSTYLYVIISMIFIALLSQAAFGGLEDFNLDIEKVYEFRREAASRIPQIFAYVYSNVSSTLIPILVVTSIKLKRYGLLFLAFFMTIFMFGMSHHKTVLFGPIFVAMLYMLFAAPKLRGYIVSVFFLIPILSILEVSYVKFISDGADAAYWTSVIVRRVLFVPGMADGAYIDFFSSNPKFYWSYSTLFSWAMTSPYSMTPPFIIGFEYFSDLDTSANTGIIGRGFANAGLMGVAFYAVVTGLLISALNFYGERIDRAAVAAISLTTVFNILTSTDLLTAFLTHGLLLLVILLALYPREERVAGQLGFS